MKKTVIINRGIPASGKSSFAKEIISTCESKGLKATSHSTDDFFMVDGEYRFDEAKLREYHLKNQDAFFKSLESGVDLVICDNTNIEPWEAKVYYNMAREFNYKIILMNFKPRDLEEHFKDQNNEEYKHNIPKDILKSMLDRYNSYDELTAPFSYPTSKLPKKEYDEKTQKVEVLEEASEPFYYDHLITIEADEYLKIKEIVGGMIINSMREFDIDEIKLIPKQYKTIMKEFHKRADKTLTAYELVPILDKSHKQIERYFEDLMYEFHNIIEVKKDGKKAYKFIDTLEVLIEAFKQDGNLDDLFYLAQESNPELFKKLDFQFSNTSDVYLFRNAIFESISNKEIFDEIKNAIKGYKYIDIKFQETKQFITVKPIKLVFTDNNWYLAYIDEKKVLKLGRISFIKDFRYSKYKNKFQAKSIKVDLQKLEKNLQNSMTLYGVEPKTAKLKASPYIAKYFKKDMKRFLSTQKFIKEEEDGSVIFSVDYTQELEILPFVQKWMPDLVILEPQELRDAYKKKLQEALNSY